MEVETYSTGFTFGPAEVIRLCSDPKNGVWILVAGDKQEVDIRVTPSGQLRLGSVVKRKQHPRLRKPRP